MSTDDLKQCAFIRVFTESNIKFEHIKKCLLIEN